MGKMIRTDKHNVSILVKCYVTLVQNNFRKCRRSDSDWWCTWLEMISCNHEWIVLGCQCAAASNAASPDKLSLFLSLSHTRFRSLCSHCVSLLWNFESSARVHVRRDTCWNVQQAMMTHFYMQHNPFRFVANVNSNSCVR